MQARNYAARKLSLSQLLKTLNNARQQLPPAYTAKLRKFFFMNNNFIQILNSEGQEVINITVDDNSYRNRVIMGEHSLTLYYSLPQHVEIPIGAYCMFKGEKYTLMRPEQLKMRHTRAYEYTVVLSSEQEKAKIWKCRNMVDGRLKFPLTAKPKEHLQMIVDNLNRREGGWVVGDCIEDVEKLISYDHDYCWDALGKIASEFETEFEIDKKRVSLRRIEYNKSTPLPLSYGRGNGFLSGIGRSNPSDNIPVEILYVQGGETNIDRSKYPDPKNEVLRASSNGCLLLPPNQTIAYDGEHFQDEAGFNKDQARTYVVDELGLFIRNVDQQLSSQAEDSLDRSDDYPKRVGKVTRVEAIDAEKNLYDIIDTTIPDNLNYSDYLIGEEKMTVIFQSGMLAGKEFEVKYKHNEKRFEIVPQEIDGLMMPGGVFVPKEDEDTYAVFHVMLPDSYIQDDETKSGASWDMFRAAVRYMFDNEEKKFTFTGELDPIWAKRNWTKIEEHLRLGGYVRFTHEEIAPEGALVRITGIKDYVNKPHSPKIELSNETVSGSFSTTLKQLESTEVVIEENHRAALQYTKRHFRDAKETMEMLESAMLSNFSESISPIAVETMMLLIGDPSLQFQFVKAPDKPGRILHLFEYDSANKRLMTEGGFIRHLTLGSTTLGPASATENNRYWDVAGFTSDPLSEPEKRYFLYIKALKEYSGQSGSATFMLDENAHSLEEQDFYWFLVGILNSEYNGTRSFVTLYGFTEILPGRITTDRIACADATAYLDLANSAMKLGDAFDYNSQSDQTLRLKCLMTDGANIANFVLNEERLESTSKDINDNPNIVLDGKTGGAYFNGSIINPFKRITRDNYDQYFVPNETGWYELDLQKTGLKFMLQFPHELIKNGSIYIPCGIELANVELEIYNASTDQHPLTGFFLADLKWEDLAASSTLPLFTLPPSASPTLNPGEYIRMKNFPLIASHFDTINVQGWVRKKEGMLYPWIIIERKQL